MSAECVQRENRHIYESSQERREWSRKGSEASEAVKKCARHCHPAAWRKPVIQSRRSAAKDLKMRSPRRSPRNGCAVPAGVRVRCPRFQRSSRILRSFAALRRLWMTGYSCAGPRGIRSPRLHPGRVHVCIPRLDRLHPVGSMRYRGLVTHFWMRFTRHSHAISASGGDDRYHRLTQDQSGCYRNYGPRHRGCPHASNAARCHSLRRHYCASIWRSIGWFGSSCNERSMLARAPPWSPRQSCATAAEA